MRRRTPRATYPGAGAGRAVLRAKRSLPPYLVLLRVGFTLPPRLRGTRCALTAPFHPYPGPAVAKPVAVCFLWHFPWTRVPQALPGTLPQEPGLSSRYDDLSHRIERLPGRLRRPR